uniref:Uncharacterized protein n=1 Tax=Trichogramma kaykai TaxID=54128 RepID=A0ABD2WB28_9HYME
MQRRIDPSLRNDVWVQSELEKSSHGLGTAELAGRVEMRVSGMIDEVQVEPVVNFEQLEQPGLVFLVSREMYRRCAAQQWIAVGVYLAVHLGIVLVAGVN